MQYLGMTLIIDADLLSKYESNQILLDWPPLRKRFQAQELHLMRLELKYM